MIQILLFVQAEDEQEDDDHEGDESDTDSKTEETKEETSSDKDDAAHVCVHNQEYIQQCLFRFELKLC